METYDQSIINNMKPITPEEKEIIQQVSFYCKNEKAINDEFSIKNYVSQKFQEKFGINRSTQLLNWLIKQKEITGR